jgi:hypothetical protein
VERLVACRNMPRVHSSRQRLDALALAGKAEADQVGAEGIVSILVADRVVQLVQVVVKPTLLDPDGVHGTAERRAGISTL